MSFFSRICLVVAMFLPCVAWAQGLPAYRVQDGLEGQIRIVGSDSMDPLLRLWTQEFQKLQPKVKFTITSHGSATAPPALIKGEADLGTMSREMNPAERDACKAQWGHEPQRVCAAFDALAIFVNRRNPLPVIRLDQLDGLYSETRLSGYAWPIRTWRAFGIQRSWGRSPIRAYTRDEKSGSRALFTEKVLRKGGKMRTEILEADQMGILEAVGSNVRALGYGPLSYAGPQVRMVPLSSGKSQPAILPTPSTIRSGTYPLARQLSFYLDPTRFQEPGSPLRPFLEFVISRNGQELVTRDGDVSLDAGLAQEESKRLR